MSLILGLIIGIVMGLTGAGGALVAIPLFITFLNMPLKQATLQSLVAVIIASLSNFYFQRKFTDYKISFSLVIFAAIGSYLSNPFKNILPDLYVSLLLGGISLYSLYSVWNPAGPKAASNGRITFPVTILIGLSLGVLTTFTGLGGGVLLLPILVGPYGFHQNRAVATGLLTVALSSLASLIIQIISGAKFQLDFSFALLVSGILLSAFVVKIISQKIPSPVLSLSRKIVFALVVALALAKLFPLN
jgi:uncharacterized protein